MLSTLQVPLGFTRFWQSATGLSSTGGRESNPMEVRYVHKVLGVTSRDRTAVSLENRISGHQRVETGTKHTVTSGGEE